MGREICEGGDGRRRERRGREGVEIRGNCMKVGIRGKVREREGGGRVMGDGGGQQERASEGRGGTPKEGCSGWREGGSMRKEV